MSGYIPPEITPEHVAQALRVLSRATRESGLVHAHEAGASDEVLDEAGRRFTSASESMSGVSDETDATCQEMAVRTVAGTIATDHPEELTEEGIIAHRMHLYATGFSTGLHLGLVAAAIARGELDA